MSPQEVSQRDSLNCKHISCFTGASHTYGLTFLIPADAESLNALTEGFIISSLLLDLRKKIQTGITRLMVTKIPVDVFFRTVPSLSDHVLSSMR